MRALSLGQRAALAGRTRLKIVKALLQSLCLLEDAASTKFGLGLICPWFAGMTMTLSGASVQTLIQATVEAGMRGRVMSLYGMVIRGGPSIGALIMGTLSEYLGLQIPLLGGCLLALLVWWWVFKRRERIRQALEEN
jgi:predicted MFS family arabinose efflux permease